MDPGQSPLRLDKYLLDKLKGISRNRIQNGIKNGQVTVNNKSVKSNHKVSPGEIVYVLIPKSKAPDEVLAEDIPLDIRYEDDEVMIVHKPAGLVVHPGIGNHAGTLVNGLVHYFNKLKLPILEGNLPDRPGLVHRIDKNTSGLLVIAKTNEALTHLAKQFFDHSVHREYVAYIWGDLPEEKGTIEAHVGRDPKHRIKHRAFPDKDAGKLAITHYDVEMSLYYISKVKFQLETGRTHQIRVHMNYLGNPIFADALYGGHQIMKGTVFSKYKQFVHNCFSICNRQALHAKSLGFVHPKTNKEMFFDSDLPDDMQGVWDKWVHYVEHRKDMI